MDISSDEIRGVRQRKKNCDPTCCPVCGITVRTNEIEQHYSLELEKLHKPNNINKRKLMAKDGPSCSTGTSGSSGGGNSSSSSVISAGTTTSADPADVYECWSTYQRIKSNRQARLKMKNKKRKTDDPLCPICNERISDDIIGHVDLCLQRSEGKSNGAVTDDDDDDSVDVETESFDEYEWAGQIRVRASSMLDGGYSAAGIGTHITYHNTNGEDEDEDLNVDGDDTQVFGTAQYTELDVIMPLSEPDDKKGDSLYLRNLVIGQSSTTDVEENGLNKATTSKRWSEHMTPDVESKNMSQSSPLALNSGKTPDNFKAMDDKRELSPVLLCGGAGGETPGQSKIQLKSKMALVAAHTNCESQKQIIESLKERIRDHEQQISNKSKCLICIDEFRCPVVSICCWHVHCEECWLRTLGARKLCPQCNMITSPSDLRRIYM